MATHGLRGHVHAIVACHVEKVTGRLGIGKNGSLPWRSSSDLTSPLPSPPLGDMQNFSRLTKQFQAVACPGRGHVKNAVVMGRKTWESLPESRRPLKDRINVVLSRSQRLVAKSGTKQELCFDDLHIALDYLREQMNEGHLGDVFIIGGEEIYQRALNDGLVDGYIFLTRYSASNDIQCDRFFPEIENMYGFSPVPYPFQHQQRQGMTSEGSADVEFLAFAQPAVYAACEAIVQRDEGHRGIQSLIRPRSLAIAANQITSGCDHMTVVTGFPCLVDCTPPTETDGIAGSIAVCRAALRLGQTVTIATDDSSEQVLRSCIGAEKELSKDELQAAVEALDDDI